MTSGSCLLAAGAVADVVGSRPVFLTGCFFLACFVLACGLARTGIELIIFRAMQGLAVALCLPTSVGILTRAVARGKILNMGFTCIGLGQPLGFSLGLVLGGILDDTIGWRAGRYVRWSDYGILSCWGLAIPADSLIQPPTMKRLKTDIDWSGCSNGQNPLLTILGH